MRGFDPNGSLVMDQSIVVHNNDREPQPFNADESMVGSYRGSETYQPPNELIT
jgi:hypothetical protein